MMDGLIEKPRGYFDLEYLTRLSEFCRPGRDQEARNYFERRSMEMSSPQMIFSVANSLLKFGIDLQAARTLDVGAGNGYVLASLAMHDCHSYGFEDDSPQIRTANRLFDRLPLNGGPRPQIIEGNFYKTENLECRFDDSTTIGDIDFFYMFAYRSYGLAGPLTLLNELRNSRRAKIGAIVYISTLWSPNNPLIGQMGFEVLPPRNGQFASKFVQKTKNVEDDKLPKDFADRVDPLHQTF